MVETSCDLYITVQSEDLSSIIENYGEYIPNYPQRSAIIFDRGCLVMIAIRRSTHS